MHYVTQNNSLQFISWIILEKQVWLRHCTSDYASSETLKKLLQRKTEVIDSLQYYKAFFSSKSF